MVKKPEPYETVEDKLAAVSEDASRLLVALKVAIKFVEKDSDLMHFIIGPPDCQLTVGHVIKGAIALHEQVEARRPR